jgi:hypothetical protein
VGERSESTRAGKSGCNMVKAAREVEAELDAGELDVEAPAVSADD